MRNVFERFAEKCLIVGECWEWQARVDPKKGYGEFHLDGRSVDAHRVAYSLFVGDIPDGMMVLHRCDNRKCCNPRHLFLGTHADNMLDCKAKQRTKRSECLSDDDVLRIKDDPRAQRTIAAAYGISQTYVWAIKAGTRRPKGMTKSRPSRGTVSISPQIRVRG